MLKFRQTPLERLRRFHQARYVPVMKRILAENAEFFSNLNETDATEFRLLHRELEYWMVLESTHGAGAILDLEHPMIARFLRHHRHLKLLRDEHIANAVVFRTSKQEVARLRVD